MTAGLRPLAAPLRFLWQDIVRRGLEEDLGGAGDLTTDAIVSADSRASARLVTRAAGCIAGLEPALYAFELLDPSLGQRIESADGLCVEPGAVLATIECSASALLSAERTALNLLGRLCGIATATRHLVDVVDAAAGAGFRPDVVCTRKTTPGLRALEKYAVRAGGGANHRFGLDDAVLIKDNHIALAGGVEQAMARVRGRVGHLVKVEVEVDTIAQLEQALALGAEAVLLDNMSLDQLREAVALCRGRALTEASGGVSRETIAAIAATGVDLISVGWLTHSAPALDIGLDVDTLLAES